MNHKIEKINNIIQMDDFLKDKLNEFTEATAVLQNNADLISNNIRTVENKLHELKLYLKFELEVNSATNKKAIVSWELYEKEDNYRLMLSYKDDKNNDFKKPFICHPLNERNAFAPTLSCFLYFFTKKIKEINESLRNMHDISITQNF